MAFDITKLLQGIPNMLTGQGQQSMPNMLANPQAPQQQGGIMGALRGFSQSPIGQNIQNAMLGWAQGGTMQDSLGKGAQMVALGRREREGDQQRNQTLDFLRSKGMDDQTAQAAMSSPTVLSDVLKGMIQGQDPMKALELEKAQLEVNNLRNPTTDDLKEYQAAKAQGYVGTFTDWQTKGIKDQDATFGREQGLRKEYTGTAEYKRYDDVRAAYERIRASAARGSGAGDLGTIFGFMKMLDPGSVVREGEFANAENSAGVPERVRNLYNRVMEGERLTPEQRAEFVGTADSLYGQEAARINSLNERYSGIAGQYELDPARIIIEAQKYDPLDLGTSAGALPEGVTEDDITETMRANNMTREQVLERLKGK